MVSHATRSIFLFSLVVCALIAACSSSNPVSDPEPPLIEHIQALNFPKYLPPAIKPCPDDMAFISDGQYCIDTYEAPDQKGAYPLYAQSAFQAEAYCSARQKRLCTHQRWYTACTGPEKMRYPYGNTYRKGTCNDDKVGWTPVPWEQMGSPAWLRTAKGRYKGEPSGNRPNCVSGYGVYDLTGNVAEWVREPRVHYKYVVKGGYWYGVMFGTPSCGFSNIGHSPNFNSYEFGFRCCKDAD